MKLVPPVYLRLPRLLRVPRVGRLLTLMILTLGLFGCDYASKSTAKEALGGGEVIQVAPALLHGAVELRYVENDDIAFNALARLGLPRTPAVLLGLSSVAVLGIAALFAGVAFARRAPRRSEEGRGAGDAVTPVALALVAGGALGNIADRATRGIVVDFIHVRGWPVFNVADIAVVVGMGLLAIAQVRRRELARRASG